MEPNTFVELFGAEYAYSKLLKRSKQSLLHMISNILIYNTKCKTFTANQLADVINFFCCGNIFENPSSSNYRRIAKMLDYNVDDLTKLIKKWKCVDERILYDLFDFFCPTKNNEQHIMFLINYVNLICNNKITLSNDKLNNPRVDYMILKIFIGISRNKFGFDSTLSRQTKMLLIETEYKHVLIKIAILKASEHSLVHDIYNIILNNLLALK
jgi:hypothetical protein